VRFCSDVHPTTLGGEGERGKTCSPATLGTFAHPMTLSLEDDMLIDTQEGGQKIRRTSR
jgi:hypothetical protein